ncbi:MAG: AI-2E family transporter [Thermoleophilia bacterium]
MRVPPVPRSLDRASGWAWRLLLCAAALVAVLALLVFLQVIVLPVLVALTISPALLPLTDWLRCRGIGRPAAAISLVLAIALVAGLAALVAVSIVSQYDELADAAQRGVERATAWLDDQGIDVAGDGSQSLADRIGTAWSAASDYLVAGLRTGVSLVAGVVLAVAMLYFVLRDGRGAWRGLLGRLGAENRPAVERAGHAAWKQLAGYVRGTALIAALDALLIGIGIALLGVPLVLPLAVLVFLGGFIPFAGATLTGAIAVLVAFADEGGVIALATLGVVLGVQFVEGNFLQPIVQSRTVSLHPAVVILAVAAGGSLFGILGAFLAVPVVAVAVAFVRSLADEPIDPRGPADAGAPEHVPP